MEIRIGTNLCINIPCKYWLTFGSIVFQEDSQAVNEVGTVQRITTNSDAKSLTEANLGSLVDGLIGKGTRARDDTNVTALVNVTRHDTNLALVRSDDTRAVGTNQTGLVLGQKSLLNFDHIVLRNTLSDGNNQRNFGFDGFQNSGSSARRGNVDDGSVSLGFLDSLKKKKKEKAGESSIWVVRKNALKS